MSSDFEKALARASSDHAAREDAKARRDRHDAEQIELARSIIDPVLAVLGPQVVKGLRDRGIGTKREYVVRYRVGLGPSPKNDETYDLGYWEFFLNNDGESYPQRIRLEPSGRIGGFSVALIQDGDVVFASNAPGFCRLYANLDDRSVYILDEYPLTPDRQFVQLGDFLAQEILNAKNP